MITVSNLLGIVIGLILIIVGLILLVAWWPWFIAVLQGIIPILLILFGIGALVYFISEMKSKIGMEEEKKTETKSG